MPQTLDFADLGEGIGNATAVLRNNAASAGLDVTVPSRAGWTMRDLVVDQGRDHRVATAALRAEAAPTEGELDESVAASSDLLEWLDDGMVELLNALAADPQDKQAWFHTGRAPADRHQAARRLCHDTTRHAVEGMAARLGRPPRADEVWFSPALARDGIDWFAGSVDASDDPRVVYLSLLSAGGNGS